MTALQREHGIGHLRGLVAEHQQALAAARAQIAIERHRLLDLGKTEDAALFGRLDDIGAHPLVINPRDLGEAGQNRLQRGSSHLDRFLHHIVEPGMFQRRKHVSEIGQAILLPGLGNNRQAVGPLAPRDNGLPFAVASVEGQDRLARGEPQHVAEIIALAALEGDGLALCQRGLDEQPGAAKIELRHV